MEANELGESVEANKLSRFNVDNELWRFNRVTSCGGGLMGIKSYEGLKGITS